MCPLVCFPCILSIDLQRLKDCVADEWQRLIDACGPLLTDIVGVNDVTPLLKELDAAGNFTLDYLKEHYNITMEHVEALYECAKFRYECGEYAVAVDYLNYYRLLVGNSELTSSNNENTKSHDRSLQVLWGRFAAEILVELWDDANRDLYQLLGAIRQSRQSDLQVMQQRAWLLHWSLFVFANHKNGKDSLVDFFMNDGGDKVRDKISNLHVIILTCPWLLRYLVAAVLVNKQRQKYLKSLLRILSPNDVNNLNDPMIDFLYKLLGSFDFEGAQQKLADCASVFATDYFLSNMMTADEFLAAARRFVFEVYCRVHQTIDIKQLAAQLHMDAEEAEKWIVDLIRSAQIDARLDAKTSSLQMIQPDTTLYQQINENTRDLITRTRNLVESLDSLGIDVNNNNPMNNINTNMNNTNVRRY